MLVWDVASATRGISEVFLSWVGVWLLHRALWWASVSWEGFKSLQSLASGVLGKPQAVVVEPWLGEGYPGPALCSLQLESKMCAPVISLLVGLICGASGKEPDCQCRRPKRCWLSPWVGKIP